MSQLSAALFHSTLIWALLVASLALLPLLFRRPAGRIVVLGVIDQGAMFGLAALLALPIISPFPIDPFKLIPAIAIELFCILLFVVSGLRIVRFMRSRKAIVDDRAIALLILAKLGFFALNYAAAGGQYGIFSDDSRIDFLTLSPTISKTRYLDGLIDFVVLLNVGARCISARRVRLFDAAAVLAINAFGFLTGSKGGTLLLMAYAMLFLYVAFPKAFSSRTKAIIVAILVFMIFAYMVFLSTVLQVTLEELLNLSLARFVLSADARIMSFDPNVTSYVLSQPHGTLLAELFRGVSRAIGAPVAEFTMGIYQFEAELGTSNFVGSTSQLSALFVTYGGDFWLGEFMVVAGVVLAAFKLFSMCLQSRSPALAWAAAASLYQLNTTLPQGFEAYVQLLPICVIVVLVFWAFRRRLARRRPDPPAKSPHGVEPVAPSIQPGIDPNCL
ncbi:MAG: hypothetical protein ABI699_04690 [Caldimonas sp.]